MSEVEDKRGKRRGKSKVWRIREVRASCGG